MIHLSIYRTPKSFWESDCSGNYYNYFEEPENPLKWGLEKVIQNIENPEWESFKMLKMLGIQSENP